MASAHARAAMMLVTNSSAPTSRLETAANTVRPQLATSETRLRVLIAERRASAHSELSRRLDRAGHEVLARVTSGQGVLDYAELLRPDVVLIAPTLEDGPGVMAAISLTRELPGIAAVVLSTHPAAADPAARPNWGAVAIVPVDAEVQELDEELWRAVGQARDAAAIEVTPEPSRPTDFGPVDLPSAVPPTPQYQTPVPEVPPIMPAPRPAAAPQAATKPAPAVAPQRVAAPAPQARVSVVSAEPAAQAHAPGVTRSPSAARPNAPATPAPAADGGGRRPLSFTDEDLIAIGPFEDQAMAGAPAVVATPIAAPVAPAPLYDADTAVIAEAAECLLERTGLSRSDAMRLMEQEAADTGRRLVDVAHSVLEGEGTDA